MTATNRCGKPLCIIKTSSSDDHDVLMSVNSPTLSIKTWRTFSLPDCRRIYKDLTGKTHRCDTTQRPVRSRSFPSTFRFVVDEERRRTASFLEPNAPGLRSPGGSSSRYSLYGSFVDLSECDFPPARKLFVDRQEPSLLLVDSPANTVEDKCNDWLNQLEKKDADEDRAAQSSC